MTQPLKHLVRDAGSGRFREATLVRAGDDLVIVVGGGTDPHIGSVVLAQPHTSSTDPEKFSASISVLTIPPHKEEEIARKIAETVCKSIGRVTLVSAGVHEDNLDGDGIKLYLELAKQMAEELALKRL